MLYAILGVLCAIWIIIFAVRQKQKRDERKLLERIITNRIIKNIAALNFDWEYSFDYLLIEMDPKCFKEKRNDN